MFTPADGIKPCPRCHRRKLLGVCNDGCKMCQSCFHVLHGMGELPSDTMEQEIDYGKHIFSLVKTIWGKDKTSKGFNWIAAKYGPHWSTSTPVEQEKILYCLESKSDQVECPVHKRIHTAKP